AHAWAITHLRPCLKECKCRIMVDGFSIHALYNTKIIDDFRSMRQQLTHPCTRLPVLIELKYRGCQRKFFLISSHTRKPLTHTDRRRKMLPEHFLQFGFIVKKIQLRRSAVLK